LKEKAVEEGVDVRRDFPGDARWLTDSLRKVSASLMAVGYSVGFKDTNKGTVVVVSRVKSTTLDAVVEAQVAAVAETDWGVERLREFRERKRSAAPLEDTKPISLEETRPFPQEERASVSEAPRPAFGDRLKALLDCFPDDVIEDEKVYELLEAGGVGRVEAMRLISTLMRDGAIFSPRAGWYRRSAA
jgi:hypothetical protein